MDPHTTLPSELDRNMAELEAVVVGSSPPVPKLKCGNGKSTSGGPSRPSQANKGKKQCSKTERTKWSAEEDEVLVSAWLNVSQDPIVRKDQSCDSYWSRIAEYFNSNKTGQVRARTMKGMVNHWALINECVSKYVGYLNQTDGVHKSGSTERDRMAHAARMYQDIEGKPFAFHHCWLLLADHPKWSMHMSNKKQKTVEDAAGSNDIPKDLASQASFEKGARPQGCEAAKAARKRACTSSTSSVSVYSEHFEKLNETKAELVRIKREQLTMLKEAENERIMKIDLNSCTGALREYYEGRQDDILMARRKRNN